MRRGWVVEYTIKEEEVMWGALEAQLEKDTFDCIVPMMGGSTEAIMRFLEDPVFVFLGIRVANWRSYYIDLIVCNSGVE